MHNIYQRNFSTDDKKDFWKTFTLLNKKHSLIPTLVHGNVEAIADNEMLNKYFVECWNTLVDVPPLTMTPQSNHEDMLFEDNLFCVEEEVYHLLMSLDISKATGPDGVSVRMLKETACVIAPSLTQRCA